MLGRHPAPRLHGSRALAEKPPSFRDSARGAFPPTVRRGRERASAPLAQPQIQRGRAWAMSEENVEWLIEPLMPSTGATSGPFWL